MGGDGPNTLMGGDGPNTLMGGGGETPPHPPPPCPCVNLMQGIKKASISGPVCPVLPGVSILLLPLPPTTAHLFCASSLYQGL